MFFRQTLQRYCWVLLPEVESLIKELEKIEGIDSVSKGRFFIILGLAQTFQVGIDCGYQFWPERLVLQGLRSKKVDIGEEQ
ncbi:hypothetical protein PIB30_102207 [Stylosanthes scabra]|uniref:Uncharacterized protein n=1 Tax=Stylosanthes scabra TaxID=79078 RepID=A0ABU6ZWB4_9FABA|nr:hypothetical protein [Stylosanthes scabra]